MEGNLLQMPNIIMLYKNILSCMCIQIMHSIFCINFINSFFLILQMRKPRQSSLLNLVAFLQLKRLSLTKQNQKLKTTVEIWLYWLTLSSPIIWQGQKLLPTSMGQCGGASLIPVHQFSSLLWDSYYLAWYNQRKKCYCWYFSLWTVSSIAFCTRATASGKGVC